MDVYTSPSQVPAQPGRYRARIPVTTDLNGLDVVVWAHVLVGSRPGPRLALLSGLHGNEWLHLEFFRRLVETFDPTGVTGSVVLVPMANAVAFGSLSRYVRDDSDNADANRSFPGGPRRFTWLAEQIATVVAEQVLAGSAALVDFHLGIWGSAMGSTIVGTDYSRPQVNERSLDLALAFGVPLVQTARMIGVWPGPRSSQSYAGEVLGIPCCGSFLGGAGFDRGQEEEWIAGNLAGIHNVMVYLGMLPGPAALPESYLAYELLHRVNPRCGGLLEPARCPEQFGRPVAEGEYLGRVLSPFTFDTLEELRSPVAGYLGYWARNYPLRPGDWAYGVIPADHPGTRRLAPPAWSLT